MVTYTNDWLITSDIADEVAFRIDLPGPDRGRWVVSYMPLDRRYTREQAVASIALAEAILIAITGPHGTGGVDTERAGHHANTAQVSLEQAACLLALRGIDPLAA